MSSGNKALEELDLGEPPEEVLQWAKENIGEDPETKCQILSDFRDMIYARGECTPHRTDDEFLLRFLRARFFIVKRAHRLLVNYCDFKEENSQLCQNIDLLDLSKIAAHQIISRLPYRDANGRKLLQYRAENWNPEKVTVEEIFQSSIAVLEMGVMEPQTQIFGGNCLFDFGGLTIQQAWYMTPAVAHKIFQLMATCFPLRLHELHIVNQSYIFDIMYNIFKPFLNDTMKKRIFFHGEDMESLHKHIDPKYLPERYGGIHPDYSCEKWAVSVRNSRKVVDEFLSLGYTDSKFEKELESKS